MARNTLSTTRKENELFEKDVVKGNRERGNQGQYNRKKFRYKNTLAFVIGYAIGYVIFSLFVGLINFLYDLIKTELGFGENYENYLHYVVKDAFSLPSMMFIGILALVIALFSFIWHLRRGNKEGVAGDHLDINTLTNY